MAPTRRLSPLLALIATIAWACDAPSAAYRGAGLPVDTLPTADLVAVYRATLAGSFTLDDPTLSLLIDPVLLPRSATLTGGDTMPSEVVAGLRATRVVQGLCKLPIRTTRMPLLCPAERAGYVVRFSEPFAMGEDSVQVHLVVQQYAIPNGPASERLRFERAYHVARQGGTGGTGGDMASCARGAIATALSLLPRSPARALSRQPRRWALTRFLSDVFAWLSASY